MKYASVGSISHGTLRTEDLLQTFAAELEYHIGRNAELPLTERNKLTKLVQDAYELDDCEGAVAEISKQDVLVELTDALEAFAPPYCYFGSHEGDGSDFGFWPSMEQIEELSHLTDDGDAPSFAEQAKALGEDCIFVNDHGNVTVYGADGSILLELV